MSQSPTKLTELQKKQLEKIFARLVDNSSLDKDGVATRLNEEGKKLCAQAKVKPDDLLIKNIEYFRKPKDENEVVDVRHKHYVARRLCKYIFDDFLAKLQEINKVIENNAIRKKIEADAAE